MFGSFSIGTKTFGIVCNFADIVNRVMSPSLAGEIFRPNLEDDDFVIIPQIWKQTLKKSWHENVDRRTTFETIFHVSKSFQK